MAKAQQALVDVFSGGHGGGRGGGQGGGRLLTVLLVDEIDMLMTRDQSVLYNVFGWPHCPGARLAIIGIANTLDLPQRLMPKIARCVHAPAPCACASLVWLDAFSGSVRNMVNAMLRAALSLRATGGVVDAWSDGCMVQGCSFTTGMHGLGRAAWR